MFEAAPSCCAAPWRPMQQDSIVMLHQPGSGDGLAAAYCCTNRHVE